MTAWHGRDKPSGEIIGTIVVSIRIFPEDDVYVGVCDTFDVASMGDTVEEAHNATLEAIECYLEAIDDVGERDKVFAERGVFFFPGEPPEGYELPGVAAKPGEFVIAERVSVAG